MVKDNSLNLEKPHINWECSGKFNFTTGYGATKTESLLANYAAFIAPVIMYFLSWQSLSWSWVQIVVAGILLLDMVGGVITNSLSSMKRLLYSNQDMELSFLAKLVQSKYIFPAIHFQMFLVPLCFDVSWGYAIFWYAFMMISIISVHALPLYLRRPVALGVVMISILIGEMIFVPPVGLEWLAPIFIIKLVFSHAVREEPYRPLENLESVKSLTVD